MLAAWYRRVFARASHSRPLPHASLRHIGVGLEPLEARALLATITVTGTGDTIAVDGFVTLREALTAANTNAASGDASAGTAGLDTINFNIAGAPGTVHTIQPQSALPTITDAVNINGYSQLGAGANTAATGTSAFLAIELDGTNAGFTAGLTISAGNSTVQGLVINNFNNEGILVITNGGNVIRGNFLGTDQTGKLDHGNGISGVSLLSSNNTVGGTALAHRNIISGNDFAGIAIVNAGATGNTIQGNLIGTDDTGAASLGNNGAGVRIANGTNTIVGGATAGGGNVIAFNTGAGIHVGSTAGAGNIFLANSIHSNGGLGIDLNGDGVTANDALDADSGPNGLQNSPVLTLATPSGASTVVTGSLHAAASASYRIEFFACSAADPSGFGEGQTFLGFVNATTDSTGNAAFTFTTAVAVPVGALISATATHAASESTSEFSGVVFKLPNPGAAVLSAGTLLVSGTSQSDSILIQTNPSNTAQIRVTVNGKAVAHVNKANVQRIAAFGLVGNDTILVQDTLNKRAELHGHSGNDHLYGGSADDQLFGEGGADLLFGRAGNDWLDGGGGNDRLEGQAGNDILLGSAGNDTLLGREGRDILIGGLGADIASGGFGDDILIGGTTDHDGNSAALASILAEWTTPVPLTTRLANLKAGTGLNGSFVLTPGGTIDSDASADRLTGDAGFDWLLRSFADGDVLNGLAAGQDWVDTI